MSARMTMIPALLVLAAALVAPWDGWAAAPAKAQHAHMMVVAANPLAARAGLAVLRRGGSAIDAAVAVQAVLGLVEPQSSGLGGGALLLSYTAKTGAVAYYDGRETAPQAAGPGLFLRKDGTPMSMAEAVTGGRSVGVPGSIAALELAHKEGGRLPWAELFTPAIALAETGFAVTPRLAAEAAREKAGLEHQAALRDYLHGGTLAVGTMLKNPDYADTLRRIAAAGSAGVLRGKVAADIALAVRQDANPGLMTVDDLAAYKPVRRDALCGGFAAWRVCTAGSPSAGGFVLLQVLGMLADRDAARVSPHSAEAAMLTIEAERLAMADRDAFGADADFASVPLKGLVAPAYVASRAAQIETARAAGVVAPGEPVGARAPAAQAPQPEHGTSDVAIVDADGNAVSMTTTVEDIFGAHLMVDGFVLNNELTDFSFIPAVAGKPVANRVEGGKRPRSSMAPALVFDGAGKLVAVVGSAGGLRIPEFVVQAVLGATMWHMPPKQALALGHLGSFGQRVELEQGTDAATLYGALTQRGEKVFVHAMPSGTSMIVIGKDGLTGAADPRRDGAAVGD
jgi:gamma-glutamyltranspeptidase/glutathione hydrolase